MHGPMNIKNLINTLFVAGQPLVGLDLLIVEVLRSHLHTPHSVGLLWTSDPPVTETSTSQHTKLTGDRQDSNLQS